MNEYETLIDELNKDIARLKVGGDDSGTLLRETLAKCCAFIGSEHIRMRTVIQQLLKANNKARDASVRLSDVTRNDEENYPQLQSIGEFSNFMLMGRTLLKATGKVPGDIDTVVNTLETSYEDLLNMTVSIAEADGVFDELQKLFCRRPGDGGGVAGGAPPKAPNGGPILSVKEGIDYIFKIITVVGVVNGFGLFGDHHHPAEKKNEPQPPPPIRRILQMWAWVRIKGALSSGQLENSTLKEGGILFQELEMAGA
jgi:hypothetical protein